MAAAWGGRTTAALVLTVAVLSGCSSEEPANETLPSASAEPSATADALPPLGPSDLPMPPEARTQDAAGAEAFTRYYIDLINQTASTMDTAPLREFSDQCSDCERIARDLEADAAAGYRYDGGTLTIESMAPAFRPGETVEVGFVVTQAPLQVVDTGGQPVEGLGFPEYPNLQSGIAARWDTSRSTWVVTTLTLG
jgi:hypothetical protein